VLKESSLKSRGNSGLLRRPHLIENDRHVTLEFDGAVPSALLALPPPARRDYAQTFLLALGGDPSCLPPFVVAGIRHVQDLAVAERQAAARQAVVLVGIVIEQRSAAEVRASFAQVIRPDSPCAVARSRSVQARLNLLRKIGDFKGAYLT